MRAFLALIRWQFRVEWRTKESLLVMGLFGLSEIVILNFALDLRIRDIAPLAPGLLWVAFAFAGMLGLSRSAARDREQETLYGIASTPLDGGDVFLAKALVNGLFMFVAQATMVGLFAFMFGAALPGWPVWGIFLLGTLGYSAVGTLLATMAVNTRAREALLPVLLFPAMIPLLLAAVRATAALWDGLPWEALSRWVWLLIGYDIIALTLGYLTFSSVLEQ